MSKENKEKYDEKSPIEIKFSKYGAIFMQLNMVAHDYVHDFNPNGGCGGRIQGCFFELNEKINNINYSSSSQIGGRVISKAAINVHRKPNILQNKQKTSKLNKIKNIKKKTNKLINLKKININLIQKPHNIVVKSSFSKKINTIVNLSRKKFSAIFYDSSFEEGIYAFIFQLLGFINYTVNDIKNGNYINRIREGFDLYGKYLESSNKVNKASYDEDSAIKINSRIFTIMHELLYKYFDRIYNENRHIFYINILNDSIYIQKLKLGFILLASMTDAKINELTIDNLINMIDNAHVILFSYLYKLQLTKVPSKIFIGRSSNRMSGGNSSPSQNDPMEISSENSKKIINRDVSEIKKIEETLSSLKTSINEKISELISNEKEDELRKEMEEFKKSIKDIFDIKPSSENTSQKDTDENFKNFLDGIPTSYRIEKNNTDNTKNAVKANIDNIFTYIEEFKKIKYSNTIGVYKTLENESEGSSSKNENNINKNKVSIDMKDEIGWNIIKIIVKKILIRNNICDASGNYSNFYKSELAKVTSEYNLDIKMCKMQIDLLYKICFTTFNKSYNIDNDLITYSTTFFEKHKKSNVIIHRSQIKSLFSMVMDPSKKYVINNAVTEFGGNKQKNSKISELKSKSDDKIFCPLSSILDGMKDCSNTELNGDQYETGITHFTIVGVDEGVETTYFNGMMEYINKTSARISVKIQNKNYGSLEYDDIIVINKESFKAVNVFNLQVTHIIDCITKIHKSIGSKNKNTTIWDLFFHSKGKNSGEDDYVDKLIKIGNRKSLGDIFQEINGVCKNGAYIKSSYDHGKNVVPHFEENDGNAPRIVLSNDRPSGVRICFMISSGDENSINENCAGGYPGSKGAGILVSRRNVPPIQKK